MAEGMLADVIDLSKSVLEAGITELLGVSAQVRRGDVRLLSGQEAVLLNQLLHMGRFA